MNDTAPKKTKCVKASDLRRLLAQPHHDYQDEELRIALAKPSVGAIATCGVQSATFGFDWEHGMLVLRPEVDLVPKTDKERVWDAAWELMMYLATKPVKRSSYEIEQARKIFERIGYDYMKYQRFLHPERK